MIIRGFIKTNLLAAMTDGNHYGFVYLITNKSNKRQYIGRKYFWSFRTPPGKKRKAKQESDWKKYYGSCPELKEDLKNMVKRLSVEKY